MSGLSRTPPAQRRGRWRATGSSAHASVGARPSQSGQRWQGCRPHLAPGHAQAASHPRNESQPARPQEQHVGGVVVEGCWLLRRAAPPEKEQREADAGSADIRTAIMLGWRPLAGALMSRREIDQEHNARSRALSDAVALESRIAQVAAGTDLGSAAKQRAAVHRRRARIEDRHYDDAVSSGEHERYWAWTPSWWRDGRLVPR
jgi:hypothetical protein